MKRTISMFLVVSFIVSLISVVAYADATTVSSIKDNGSQVALSTSSSAPTVVDKTGTFTVDVANAGAASGEFTILVAKETGAGTVADADIQYIDQVTGASGNATFTFKLKSDVPDGVYYIKSNATSGTATSKYYIKVQSTASGVKVKGYVKYPGVTVSLGSGLTATSDANGYFEISNVPAGTYTITFSKAKAITRTMSITVGSVDYEVSSSANKIVFYVGDLDENGVINILDYVSFLGAYGTTSADAGFVASVDFDNNGTINILDYVEFLGNYGASSNTYQTSVMSVSNESSVAVASPVKATSVKKPSFIASWGSKSLLSIR